MSQLHTLAVGASHLVVHNTCGDGGLANIVPDESGRIIPMGGPDYLSIKQRGPELTGVKDRVTGDTATSLKVRKLCDTDIGGRWVMTGQPEQQHTRVPDAELDYDENLVYTYQGKRFTGIG